MARHRLGHIAPLADRKPTDRISVEAQIGKLHGAALAQHQVHAALDDREDLLIAARARRVRALGPAAWCARGPPPPSDRSASAPTHSSSTIATSTPRSSCSGDHVLGTQEALRPVDVAAKLHALVVDTAQSPFRLKI